MPGPLKPLKWYRKLAAEKGRLEAGAFLVEGDKAIEQIAGSHPNELIEIVTAGEGDVVYKEFPVRHVTERQFRSISNTVTPQGTMAVVRLPRDIYSDQLPDNTGNRILLLENIQDPGNVGTLIRTAAAFNYPGVILTDKCADPFSPKCVQASAGTLLALWLRRTARYLDIVGELKSIGYTIIAADLNGEEDISIFHGHDRLLLALGNEASGLSKAVLHTAGHRFKIPIDRDRAESLNVAVSGAICMYLSL